MGLGSAAVAAPGWVIRNANSQVPPSEPAHVFKQNSQVIHRSIKLGGAGIKAPFVVIVPEMTKEANENQRDLIPRLLC